MSSKISDGACKAELWNLLSPISLMTCTILLLYRHFCMSCPSLVLLHAGCYSVGKPREMVGADCMHIGLSRATSLLSKRRVTNQALTKLADMPVSMSRGNSSVTLRTGMSLIFSCLSFLVLSLRAAPARSRRGTAAVTQTASVRPQRTKELLSWRMYLAVISTRTLKWLLMHASTH